MTELKCKYQVVKRVKTSSSVFCFVDFLPEIGEKRQIMYVEGLPHVCVFLYSYIIIGHFFGKKKIYIYIYIHIHTYVVT